MLLVYAKAVLRQLLLPPAGLLLLALAGVALLRRRPRTARSLLLCSIGALWLLSTPLIADALTRLAQRYPPLDLSSLGGAQAIVVLGGGGQRAWAPEYGGPAAGAMLLEKLSYGAFLARRTGLPLLVTGYGVEVAAMRATLRQNFGLEPRWVDARAFDTFENARNSAALLRAAGIGRIVLLTSATHMRRSVAEFTAAGLAVVPAPVGTRTHEPLEIWDYVPQADALTRSYLACYELIGEPVRALLAALQLRRQ